VAVAQVRLAVGINMKRASIGSDDIEREYVVARQAVRATVERQAAAEQIADDAHRRRCAVHCREAVRSDRIDHVAPDRPCSNPGGAADRVD
jgi:hypothetical protein